MPNRPFHLVLDARTVRPGATGVGHYVAGLVQGLEEALKSRDEGQGTRDEEKERAEGGGRRGEERSSAPEFVRVTVLRLRDEERTSMDLSAVPAVPSASFSLQSSALPLPSVPRPSSPSWPASLWDSLRHVEQVIVDHDYEDHPRGDWWLQRELPIGMEKLEADVLVSPAFLAPWGKRKFAKLLLVPDAIAWDIPQNLPTRFRWYLKAMVRLGARGADRVLTLSPHAKQRLDRLGIKGAKPTELLLPGLDEAFLDSAETRIGHGPRTDESHTGAAPNPENSTTESSAATSSPLVPRPSSLVPSSSAPHPSPLTPLLPDGSPRRAPLLVYVASFEPRKNHDVLFQALRFPSLTGYGPELALVHRASAKDHEWLKRHARRVGVRVVTPRNAADVAAWVRAANVVVFPSKYEGFGMPVLEAMACGQIVLASDIEPLRWLTNEGKCARLIPPTRPEAWAAAIAEAIAHPEKFSEHRVAAKARAAEFSWRETGWELLQIAEAAEREIGSIR